MIGNRRTLKKLITDHFLFACGKGPATSRAQQKGIANSICETNFFRGTIYSIAIILFELLLILFADLRFLGSYETSSYNIWYGYLVTHSGLLLSGIIFIILPFAVKKRRHSFPSRIRRQLPWIMHSIILSLLALVTLIDLVYSGKMIVFIYGFFISSALLLISFPWNLVVFGIPMLIFMGGQIFLPIDHDLKLYVVVNCTIIFITGILISNVSYREYFLNLLANLKLHEANRKLDHQAKHDALTGLANRRFFEEQVKREFSLMERNGQKGVLLLLDIDLFKNINDSYGHDAGDLVLKDIAAVLKEDLRDIDIIARWGGEEFIIFLPDTSPERGMQVAERIRKKLAEASVSTGADILRITASIGGFCIMPEQGLSYEDSYKVADEMLYRAKGSGRNRVIIYNMDAPQA